MKYLLLLAITLFIAACATGPDTRSAKEFYEEGESLHSSKNYEDAIAFYKKAKESYASPEITALAELRIADTHFDSEKFIEASAAYQDFINAHPMHEKAPYALFRKGMSNFNLIEGTDLDQTPVTNSVEIFSQFLDKFPKDPLAKEAQNKVKECRSKQLKYEIYVGKHYFKSEKYTASIKRLEGALAKYPDSAYHDETLFYLGKAYFNAGEKTKGKDAFSRLEKQFPESDFISKAASFMESAY